MRQLLYKLGLSNRRHTWKVMYKSIKEAYEYELIRSANFVSEIAKLKEEIAETNDNTKQLKNVTVESCTSEVIEPLTIKKKTTRRRNTKSKNVKK